MASYPTSIKSFASRSAGQTIGSAHINDLQDEVGAIETALFNGPISLQASTVATLSVTGGSTFTVYPVFPPPEAVRVSGSTTVLENNSTKAVTWPTHDYAINSSLHSTAVSPERFTPQTTGVFSLQASIQQGAAVANSTAWLQLEVLDSSGTQLAVSIIQNYGGGLSPTVSVSASKYFNSLAASPWLRLCAKQAQGSSNVLFGLGCWAEFRKL